MGRRVAALLFFICFFAFYPQTQAAPSHGSLTLPSLHWTATAAPPKKVPNGKCWVSLQLIRLNDNPQQHQCLQGVVPATTTSCAVCATGSHSGPSS